MGGYMIFRDKQPYWTLFLEDVDLERDMRLVPYYTEEELMDRSKGDVLSKGVALLQTVWFSTQYFTRLCYRLPLTELETVTLAFAVLNIATYLLWWHKPLNVQCPIRVHEPPLDVALPLSEPRNACYEHHITPHNSSSTSLSDQLSIPCRAFDDVMDTEDSAEWDELYEVPWFYDNTPSDDGTTVAGSPSSGSQTLAKTPPVDCKEIEKDGDNVLEVEKRDFCEDSEEDSWRDLNELPWFPSPEVLLSPPNDETTDAMDHRIRRTASTPSSQSPVKWAYRFPRNWGCLPRCIALTIDGGWYTIHISYDEIQNNDDWSLFDFRNSTLSVDFYVPLSLRNRPWILQMCIALPFWSPYIIFMVLYSFGPYRFFLFLLSPLALMSGTSQSAQMPWLDAQYPLQVPTFYAGPVGTLDLNSRLKIWYTIFFLASVFGAIHGFGWAAYFPSTTELVLWRISTLTICGVPPTIALWLLYRQSSFPQFGVNTTNAGTGTGTSPFFIVGGIDVYQFLKFLAARPARIGMPMYIFGRIVLITLAFTSLRGLPPDNFQTMWWTSVIPHI